jgi:heat shock protein HtpX
VFLINSVKTAALMGALAGILMLIGGLVGGGGGVAVALVIALGLNFFSCWCSDRLVLKMYRARPLSAGEEPELLESVGRLAQEAGIPPPEVYVIPSETPNAFATGRNPDHAVIGVTQGIMERLNADELSGVIAHELAHIRNRDTLLQTVAATLASAVTFIAFWARWGALLGAGSEEEGGGILALLAMAIFAPIAAALIRFAISRSEEFKADKFGAGLTRRPVDLADALQKIQQSNRQRPVGAGASHHATAHMFIVNPHKNPHRSGANTRPPAERRYPYVAFSRATRQEPAQRRGPGQRAFGRG